MQESQPELLIIDPTGMSISFDLGNKSETNPGFTEMISTSVTPHNFESSSIDLNAVVEMVINALSFFIEPE